VRRPPSIGPCSRRAIDPLAAKKATTEAGGKRRTFGQCAGDLIKSKRSEWRNAEHARQWRTTLETYAAPLWNVPIDEVDTAAVLSVLNQLWTRIPETASRLRGRIEAVLDYGKAHGLRSAENPARWRGHLALILPKRQKLSRGHHAAMDYRSIPEFVGRLRECERMHALALEFLILTAARSGEVLGARWAEFDLVAKVWTIPAIRMKVGLEHRIPMSARAIEVIERMATIRSGDLVFPGQRRGRQLGRAVLLEIAKGAGTVHGFRSSFRDWCGEETSFPREIAEQALAHTIGNAVEAAYRRGDALEKRRGLMDAWASFCEPKESSNVITMARRV